MHSVPIVHHFNVQGGEWFECPSWKVMPFSCGVEQFLRGFFISLWVYALWQVDGLCV